MHRFPVLLPLFGSSRRCVTALFGLLLATTPACGDDDGGTQGSESSDPTTSAGTATDSTTDPSTSEGGSEPTGPTTGPTTDMTTDMTTTTGDPTGTSGETETETETETTGDGVCQIELPDPGRCDAGPPAPAPKRPNLVLGSPRAALAPATAAPALGAAVAVHDGCNFIDCGEEPSTCDIYLQDCPEGEKCNPWASGGGSSWNATKCVPIAEEPDPIGGSCTVEGSGVSGVDSCEAGAMCWGVDSDTGIGTCIAHCTCSSDNPICTVANTTCAIANSGILNLCLPVCDPLDPSACESGDLCVALGEYFICVLDASGGSGTAGTPCNFANACNPGLACLNNQFWPDCQDSSCCVPFCDLSDASCPGGTSCIPWYDVGQEPKCYENVGVCIQ